MYSNRVRSENIAGKPYAEQPRKAGAKRAFGKNISNNAAHADKKNKTTLMAKTNRPAKTFRAAGAQRGAGLTRYTTKQTHVFGGNKATAAVAPSNGMEIDSHTSNINNNSNNGAKKQRLMRTNNVRGTAVGNAMMTDTQLQKQQRQQRRLATHQQKLLLQQQQQQQQQQQLQLQAQQPAGRVLHYEDIDKIDQDDAQCCTEYVQEIFAYMRQKEIAERVDPRYMNRQSDLTANMRAILIDWMGDVHRKFKLLSETLFLSVNIMDRYLCKKQVSRTKLQLLGITAMLIASKYEEIYSPVVHDFTFICDDAFEECDILSLEIQVLNKLNFSLTPATPLHFLRRFSKAARSDSHTHTLSKYLIELSLVDYNMLRFKPSTIAAAAVYIARAMHRITPYWNDTLEHYTHHNVAQLRRCAETLNDSLLCTTDPSNTLRAIYRKYSSSKLLSVAQTEPLEVLPF